VPVGMLEVVCVEDLTESTVVCVVRYVAGTVNVRDLFEAARSEDSVDRAVSLRVSRMWRYQREVDIVDPPHTAKVEFGGADVDAVPGSTHLLAYRRADRLPLWLRTRRA